MRQNNNVKAVSVSPHRCKSSPKHHVEKETLSDIDTIKKKKKKHQMTLAQWRALNDGATVL